MLSVRFGDKWMTVFDSEPIRSAPDLSIKSGHDTLHKVNIGINIDKQRMAFWVCDDRGICSDSIDMSLKEVYEAMKLLKYTPYTHSLFEFAADKIVYSIIIKDGFLHITNGYGICDSVTSDFMIALDDWMEQLYEKTGESKTIKVRIEYDVFRVGIGTETFNSEFELNTDAYYKYAGVTNDFINYYSDRNSEGGSQIVQWLANKEGVGDKDIKIQGIFFVDTLP